MAPRILLASLVFIVPVAASAEAMTYRVLLGDREIGSLAFDLSGSGEDRTASLTARFDNTPLAVADGTFEASSLPAATEAGAVVRQFLARSAFTSGGRVVSVLMDEGRVSGVTIDPAGEMTELSDPAAVPAGVIDSADAFGRLFAAEGGCPAPFRLYDGRRVVEVAVAPAPSAEGMVACSGTYRVVAGPGHLSPLGITSLSLDLAYAVGPDSQSLASVEVRTGPFVVRLEP